jgi:prephenate dehydrogenase
MTAPPRAGVVGLGLIGGSLLQGLAATGTVPLGFDADHRVAGTARSAGFQVAGDAETVARACSVVFVCVPPGRTAAVIASLLDANPDVVVADTASVKAPIVAAIANERFIPAHPLAGSERAGWRAADAALLRDAVWAVCPPSPGAPLDALFALDAVLDPLGARLLACDADAHDAALARTSHVPHVVAQALARLAEGGGLPLSAALSGGSYRDMTRTASSDAALWLDIVGANRAATATALRALLADLNRLTTAIETGDDTALADAWRSGAAARATVDAIRWSTPDWRPHTFPGATWQTLVDLGRTGVLIRRLRRTDAGLELETGTAPRG